MLTGFKSRRVEFKIRYWFSNGSVNHTVNVELEDGRSSLGAELSYVIIIISGVFAGQQR
jgi:hypothetical protein